MESLRRWTKAQEAPTTTTARTSQEPITSQGRRAARWPRRYKDFDIIGRPPRSLASTRLPCRQRGDATRTAHRPQGGGLPVLRKGARLVLSAEAQRQRIPRLGS